MLVVPMMLVYIGGISTVSADADGEESKTFGYVCEAVTSLGIDIDIDMEVTPTVSIPDTVEPNGELAIEDIFADIKIDLTGDLDLLRGLINPFEGHVDEFNIEVNGETKNAVGEDGVPIPSTPHEPEDEYVPFTVDGVDTNFTVGEEDVDLTVGQIEATISSGLGLDIPVSCTAPEDNVLATVKVEEQEDLAEEALLAVNNADTAEAMQAALENEDLGLDLAGYNELSEEEQAEVASLVFDERPEEGYADVEALQTALNQAIDAVLGEDDDGDNGEGDEEENGDDGDNGEDENGNGDDNGDDNGEGTDDSDEGGELPKTATNNPLMILISSLMTVVGGALVFIRKRVMN